MRILITLPPEQVINILNGDQRVIIRKTAPKCDLPIEVCIYCAKNLLYGDEYLCKEKRLGKYEWFEFMRFDSDDMLKEDERHRILNGRVVAKFTLNKIEQFTNGYMVGEKTNAGTIMIEPKPFYLDFAVRPRACMSEDELEAYAPDLSFFAYHISDLEIFPKPKEIIEFFEPHDCAGLPIPLTNPPKSWRYIG